ncbi:MAG TPA: glycosyltransferase family 1 protein [Bryobacteraceae bacterium]|jgi:alpha-1,3-rhamnosyl/mannosyltransferase|nr:glycosyltransferase family 1 protein [Bryobacteraceae bacterium]
MKVLIDTYPLLIRSAGVKNYLFHWVEALWRAAPQGAIGTVPGLGRAVLHHDRSAVSWWRTGAGLASLALSNYAGVPLLDMAARRADIFHVSSLVRNPPRRPMLTATLHDLTAWTMPQLHLAANRKADAQLAANLRQAHRIIAVSEATRQDAIRILGIAPEKIVTIHSGVASSFFSVAPEAVAQVRRRYRLKRQIILSVGTVEPRKNFGALVNAYRALPAFLQDEYELVVAGPLGWADAETTQRVRTVRYLGYVPERDIAGLTAAATVFAYPSLYEGFGFPVAQAMAAGVPVVTSNVSALPEIAGDAALLVDPRSETELRDALNRLLTYPDLRAKLAERGRERAEQFRWEKCAAKSWQFFQDAAGS